MHKNVAFIGMPLNICYFLNSWEIFFSFRGNLSWYLEKSSQRDLETISHKDLKTIGHRDLNTVDHEDLKI
jgi:hypothetical protein